MTDPAERLPPAFYAAPDTTQRRAITDWWVVLHPPYTLWHLSYVAIGAAVAPRFDGGRLAATLVAFLFAVGIGAHALDELHGRPLSTSIPGWVLVAAAVASLSIAVAVGIIGVAHLGLGLAGFIVVGVVLNLTYNLELFGGRLHSDAAFSAAWGAFPVLTAYYAQAETVRPVALLAAAAGYFLSAAQRSLSTPARNLRRRIDSVEGTVTHGDGRTSPLTKRVLLAPLEDALKAMTWGVVVLAVALVVLRATS